MWDLRFLYGSGIFMIHVILHMQSHWNHSMCGVEINFRTFFFIYVFHNAKHTNNFYLFQNYRYICSVYSVLLKRNIPFKIDFSILNKCECNPGLFISIVYLNSKMVFAPIIFLFAPTKNTQSKLCYIFHCYPNTTIFPFCNREKLCFISKFLNLI